jgi:hypothetical protein
MTNPKTDIKVTVHYIAAAKPFKADVSADTTLAAIKAGALSAFGLVEDANKVYKMLANKVELSNLNEDVGTAAAGKSEFQIDLEEFIVQGS